MAKKQQTAELAKVGVAVALTFIAGYVDAVGWLSLNRVFIAQMSGNMVLLAVHLVAGEDGHVWLQVDTIVGFFVGLVISGSVIEIGMRQHMRCIFVVALVVEFLMLAAFAIAGSALPPSPFAEQDHSDWLTYVLVAVVAFAMGGRIPRCAWREFFRFSPRI